MKKYLTFAILLFFSMGAFAQLTQEELDNGIKPLTDKVNTIEIDLKKEIKTLSDKIISVEEGFKTEIKTLRIENSNLKSEIVNLNSELSNSNKTIDILRNQIQENINAISQTANELGIKIKETEDKNDGKIIEVRKSLSKKSRYGIIGVLSAIMLSGLVYWLLWKRQKTDKNQLSNIISSTKAELSQESVKLDVQLIEVIEKQLKVADKLNATEPPIDHTFHKNSANELQRIANYANTLDPESQEAIALQGSLGRLRNYFNSSDYEITDFTGKEYDDRIPVRVRDTKFDESLPFGKEIIAKTWEPQIKYKGIVIQKAKIDKKYNN